MAYTYNIPVTVRGGRRAVWDSVWDGSGAYSEQVVGIMGSAWYQSSMMFDKSSVSGKTITGITLKLTVASGTIPADGTQNYPICDKADSSTTSWKRSSTAAVNGKYIRNQTAGGGTITANNTVLSIDMGTTLPTYGYVAGPRASSLSTSFKYVKLASTATLAVTTNETYREYTLAYNANGGSGAPSSTSAGNIQVNPSCTFTVSNTIPTRTGYTFLGWSTSSTATSASYVGGNSITVTTAGTTTLYAVWRINTYTVSYNANGGSGAPSAQTKTYGVTLTLSSTQPTRTGYTFLGWSTSSTATSATYSAGGSYTANAAATLYAVWQIITYTVSYNKGSNGTGTNSSATKTYNVTLTLKGAQFTRTGYEQTGWATSDGGAQAYALSGSYTANASVTLYPVWTATKSTVSTTNGTLGTQQTITITRYSTSFTHTLTGKYGNYSWTIATGVGASYAWTPPTSLAAQFPAAKSGVCTITCTTYSGSTNIGSSTTTCTLSIPSSVCCTVGTVTLTEAVSGLASKFGAFIQGKSKATINATINSGSGSPAYGATVSSYAITTNGQTLTSNGATTGILNTAGTNNSYSFKITDTRGYSNTKTGTYTVLAYSSPSVSAQISRNSSDSSKIDVKYSYSISACNNRNDKALSIKYRIVGGNYTTIPITISSYTGSNITYQITGLDANTAYEVVVTVADYFTPASTTTNIQPTGNRVFDISDDDKTIARHGTNYSDGWDHQYFNEQFHGVLDVTQRRCYANLSQPGWYRAIKFSAINAYDLRGADGSIIDIYLSRIYNYTDNEAHKISLLRTWNNNKFVSENSVSKSLGIDKIRLTVHDGGSDDRYAYIDIHYSLTTENPVAVHFNVYSTKFAAGNDYTDKWSAENMTFMGTNDPPNESVLTEYTFAANTEATEAIAAGTYTGTIISGTHVHRQGNIVTGFVKVQLNATATAGGWRNIAVIPSGFRPWVATDFNAIDNSSDEPIHARIDGSTGNVNIWPLTDKPSGRNIFLSFTYYTG